MGRDQPLQPRHRRAVPGGHAARPQRQGPDEEGALVPALPVQGGRQGPVGGDIGRGVQAVLRVPGPGGRPGGGGVRIDRREQGREGVAEGVREARQGVLPDRGRGEDQQALLGAARRAVKRAGRGGWTLFAIFLYSGAFVLLMTFLWNKVIILATRMCDNGFAE